MFLYFLYVKICTRKLASAVKQYYPVEASTTPIILLSLGFFLVMFRDHNLFRKMSGLLKLTNFDVTKCKLLKLIGM